MIFPGSGQLDYATRAADRRYQRSLLESQRAENKALLARQKELQDAGLASQQQWMDLQTAAIDGLREAIELSNEAADDALEFAKQQAEKQDKMLRPLADQLAAFTERLKRFTQATLDALLDVAKWWTGRGRSAGGLLEREALGYPFATGTIVWTLNSPPPGWLTCNGTWVRIDDYPELYNTIRVAGHGVNAQGEFRLPPQNQCPGYTGSLPPGWRAIIRT